ncbi:MAG: Ribonuclease G [Calditrichaeota bacterium]|nr:Ribonuclease G [Calditrichota bacterium]
MRKQIVINAATAETRIVLLEDNQLAEVFVERPESERHVGDIYLGRVRKVLNGISAAFVDIGWEQDGFLHFNDVGSLYEYPEANGDSRGNGRRIGNVGRVNLHPGQEILVQITKEPMGGKGPRVTSQVSLPGRFVVLVPNEESVGVSRKITNPREKRRLKRIARSLREDGFGIIVRTVAQERNEETLRDDIRRLVSTWRKVETKAAAAHAPELVYKEMTLASSVIRDLFSPEIDHLIVDSRSLHKEIVDYLRGVSPQLVDRVEFYTDRLPIFDRYEIETEIEKGLRRKVWLEGGGHILIEHTEAMVTVDVNSGRYVGKSDHEANSLRVNLRAAREICRQLRLRDIGGIIAIDFIDMVEEKNRKKLYDEVKKELKRDRAKVDVAPIGAFGLMLLTRQRIRPSLVYAFKEPCKGCHGTGMVPTRETVVTELERWIARYLYHTRRRRIRVVVHPALHEFLVEGGLRNRINRMMLRYKLFIRLSVDAGQPPTGFRVLTLPGGEDVTEQFRH